MEDQKVADLKKSIFPSKIGVGIIVFKEYCYKFARKCIMNSVQ